jgi:hypothetical protein
MARVREIDNRRVKALTGCNEWDSFTVNCVLLDYNVYSVEYIMYRVGAKIM